MRDLGKDSALALAPEEQYLVANGRTYSRDLSFDDLHRMQFDLETTGLNPDRDRIFMIAVRYPSGEADTLEPPCDGNSGEAALIRELVSKVTATDPDVIENHNLHGCPKHLVEEAFDAPNGILVRRCFRLLNAKSMGLAITLADVTEEELRVMELIDAEKQEQAADEDKDAKTFQDLLIRKLSRRR